MAEYRQSAHAVFDLKYHNLAPQIVRKTRPIQSEFEICTEYNYEWFCNDLEEPYTTPSDKPFHWLGRLRMTGGRTNVWGRVSLRFRFTSIRGTKPCLIKAPATSVSAFATGEIFLSS